MPYIDPRDRELAKVLVGHSVAAKKGELVFIQGFGLETVGLLNAIADECVKAGAAPYVNLVEPEQIRSFKELASREVMQRLAQLELLQMKDADCYIGVRGTQNSYEEALVNADQKKLYAEVIGIPVHLKERVNNTRWCVLRYPNPAMAQLAAKPTSNFAEFYYQACCADYAQMAKAVKPLAELMGKTDQVKITGPGTDLTFSIKDIPVIPCCGTHNIPDGECFTSPVRDSVNGTVFFNSPTIYDQKPFENMKLTFKDGKIVEASAANADQTKALNEILDRDEGARYVGEFAIAFNPFILDPIRDILFDEKIGGSFHMAMGQAYQDAYNGNESQVHWDMISIQRPEYGGGEMHFDGKLIRKDGQFVIPELKGLNPDAFGS